MIAPEPLTEVTRVCAPWVSQARLAACVPDATASQRQQAVAVASDVLYVLSGSQWRGICTELVRPCGMRWGDGGVVAAPGAGAPWVVPVNGVLTSYGCGCGPQDDCGCSASSYVQLRSDAVAISEVKVDGEVLDPSGYTLFDLGRLYRVGGSWPCCGNDLTRADTEPGTWSISYSYGKEPPIGAAAAAEVLACELARAAAGLPCSLPERVTSVARQGVSFNILDPQDFLVGGRTGVYAVDLFLTSANPHRLVGRSAVWWPGRQRLRRPTG
jgi:hypothetical protein